MKTKTVDEIRHRGFEGFQTIGRLKQTDCRDVPEDDGVYLVIRTAATPPSFLKRSIGGRFKGADPTVDMKVLESKWVAGTPQRRKSRAGKNDKSAEKIAEIHEIWQGRTRRTQRWQVHLAIEGFRQPDCVLETYVGHPSQGGRKGTD